MPGCPIGPPTATLSDGSQWVFKFVKIACNVASPLAAVPTEMSHRRRRYFEHAPWRNADRRPAADFKSFASHANLDQKLGELAPFPEAE